MRWLLLVLGAASRLLGLASWAALLISRQGRAWFQAPDPRIAREVERLAQACRGVAALNGAGLGLALVFAISAYTALDGNCPKQRFNGYSLQQAWQLARYFGVFSTANLLLSLAPEILGFVIRFRGGPTARCSPGETELSCAPRWLLLAIWHAQGTAALAGAYWLLLLLVSVVSYIGAQTPDHIVKWWPRLEADCRAAFLPDAVP